MYDTTRYYATVATMAAHDAPSDIQGRALARLVAVIGNGAPPANRGVCVHDGTRIVDVDDGAARLLGGSPARIVGRPVLSMVDATRRAEGAARLDALRAGAVNAPWQGPVRRLDGRPVRVRASVSHVMHDGAPAYRVEFLDVAGHERLS